MANNALAHGFIQLRHLADDRVSTVGAEVVYDAVLESARYHTDVLNRSLAGLVERSTQFKLRYALPGGGTLQPLDENGNPRPVRTSGNYDVAFPIQGGGTAWGTNRISRAKMTVAEANRLTVQAQMMDSNWIKRHILAALFTNASYSYADDLHGSLTVQPLANGDSVNYGRINTETASTDTHFLAQASAIDDSNNPFDDIYADLMEHPSNQGSDIVVYVATNLKATIQALANFTEVLDADLSPGAGATTVNAAAARINAIKGVGDSVLGKVDKVWIVEWAYLPDNYMIAHATGQTVLTMREHPEPELQGFFPENFSPDGNHLVNRMLRFAGFGVHNRVAALVYRIGNGSYTIPSGYSAPLAV